jgi:hypothetical protein
MKKELIGFLPEPGGKPKDDDQQVAGIASWAPSLQQQLPPATSLDCAPVGRGVGRGAMQATAEGVRNTPMLQQNDPTVVCPVSGSERNGRKPPGRRAKEHGTRLKRGLALQVMVYPRPQTKTVLVRAARETSSSPVVILNTRRLGESRETPRMRGRGPVTTGRTGPVPLRGKRQRWAAGTPARRGLV